MHKNLYWINPCLARIQKLWYQYSEMAFVNIEKLADSRSAYEISDLIVSCSFFFGQFYKKILSLFRLDSAGILICLYACLSTSLIVCVMAWLLVCRVCRFFLTVPDSVPLGGSGLTNSVLAVFLYVPGTNNCHCYRFGYVAKAQENRKVRISARLHTLSSVYVRRELNLLEIIYHCSPLWSNINRKFNTYYRSTQYLRRKILTIQLTVFYSLILQSLIWNDYV